MKSIVPFSVAAVLLPMSSLGAQSLGKGQYHLFNPTPPELMREMATDRPDRTESPITVDAGHLQIEFSIVEYTRDHDLESFRLMPINFRLGLRHDLECAIIVAPYVREELRTAMSAVGSEAGFGDIELRLKYNCWGNDEGDTALAFMPYITLPTATGMLTHGHVEGGLIVPFGMDLDDGWSLGIMGQFGAVYDADRSTYDLELTHTAAMGRDLIGALGAYIEYIGIVSTAPGSEYQILLGTGLTYSMSQHVQVDAGINVGLAGGAPELSLFTGMSVRF